MSAAADTRTWVTEVWSPEPDDGAVRMHSHMADPEPLPDPEPEPEPEASL